MEEVEQLTEVKVNKKYLLTTKDRNTRFAGKKFRIEITGETALNFQITCNGQQQTLPKFIMVNGFDIEEL